jgi:hypothetical protein
MPRADDVVASSVGVHIADTMHRQGWVLPVSTDSFSAAAAQRLEALNKMIEQSAASVEPIFVTR